MTVPMKLARTTRRNARSCGEGMPPVFQNAPPDAILLSIRKSSLLCARMQLFLDTADVQKIRTAASWGILDGVTTNPSHILATGRRAEEVYREIFDIVNGPVSLQTVSQTATELLEEGHRLAKIHKNAVVKVPITQEG